MFLSYITTESDGALTLDQLLRGPLSLSAREAREAKRLGLTVDGAPSTVKPSRLASRASLAESESGPRRS